jgi:hypothetical protein
VYKIFHATMPVACSWLPIWQHFTLTMVHHAAEVI